MPKNRKGLTLIEMIVYLSIFIVLSNALYRGFLIGFANIKEISFSLYEQRNLDLLVDRIRLDVANSREILPSFADYRTGKDAIVLSSKMGGKDFVTVYAWDGSHVVRLCGPADEAKLPRSGSYRLDVKRFDFSIEESGPLKYVKADIEITKRMSLQNRKNFQISFMEVPGQEN